MGGGRFREVVDRRELTVHILTFLLRFLVYTLREVWHVYPTERRSENENKS